MKIRKKILLYVGILIVTALLLMVITFNVPINTEDIPGTYEGNTGPVKDRIVIKPDGTFMQTVTVTSPVINAKASGTWEYVEQKSYIVFSNEFLLPINGFGKLEEDFAHDSSTGVSLWSVKRGFYGIQIGAHPAVRHYRQD